MAEERTDAEEMEESSQPIRRKQMISLHTPAEGWLELVSPSHFDYVRRFKEFVERLADAPLAEEDREGLRLAIDEMARNAIEWGNRQDHLKALRLSCCIFDDKLIIKIEDEGEGFDTEALSDPAQDPVAHIMKRLDQGKRAGGYGIFLTRRLVDEVMFNERGNVVLLTKYFKER